MADLANYQDKLLDENGNPIQTNGSGSGTGEVGGGVVSGGSQPSTAGIGAGGVGGWTNIQSYISANKGDTGSSNLLKSAADESYKKEASNLESSAKDAESKSESEVKDVQNAKDNSKQWVNQTAQAYNYSGPQSNDYYSTVNKVRDAMTRQYSGPNDYAYQKSEEFQKNQDALKDRNAFDSYMGNLYRQKAGGSLSQGQEQLQNQFDVNNEDLEKTKADVLSKYSGFDGLMNNRVKAANDSILNNKNLFVANQNGLKDSLNQYSNEYLSEEQKAEADARAAYDQAYKNPGSTRRASRFKADENGNNVAIGWDAMSYKDLQDYVDKYGNSNSMMFQGWGNQDPSYRDQLKSFYDSQNEKYKDTGDTEKRNWNVLQDILGTNAKKYDSGFKVRG